MLQFLNPIWLAAATGIIVPVMIHLWNIRQGRVLKVGSTLLMADATQKSASSLRISRWLLLILRCLLVIVLAMLLAQPEWRSVAAGNGKGWIVVDQQTLPRVYAKNKDRIDTLLKEGYELHDLNPGFKKISLADSAINGKTDTVTRPEKTWSLIIAMDRQLPAGFPVRLFTSGDCCNMQHLLAESGGRPQVSINLLWNYEELKAPPETTTIKTRMLDNGNFKTTSLVSAATGNYFSTSVAANNPAGNNNSQQPDTTTILVSIFQDNNPMDARYLSAAITSVAGFGKHKLSVKTVSTINELPSTQDWLFWLSDKPLPENIRTNNIFQYQPGTPVTDNSWVVVNPEQAGFGTPSNHRLISNHTAGIIDTAKNAVVIWQDGFGNPLLTMVQGTPTIYRFYSRFNPSWSELTWSPSFPALVYPLLIAAPDDSLTRSNDRRMVSHEQAMPDVIKDTVKEPAAASRSTSLEKIFWFMAFILFATERILSFYQPKLKSN